MQKLQGRVAIVTGASSGIGQGIAKRLDCEGAKAIADYPGALDGAGLMRKYREQQRQK
jgi:NAD(P)-dependent dehydrogenase (short-subunit alcohol dehydrogenase family)